MRAKVHVYANTSPHSTAKRNAAWHRFISRAKCQTPSKAQTDKRINGQSKQQQRPDVQDRRRWLDLRLHNIQRTLTLLNWEPHIVPEKNRRCHQCPAYRHAEWSLMHHICGIGYRWFFIRGPHYVACSSGYKSENCETKKYFFSSVQCNILHLLPAKSSQPYNLRPRSHNFVLNARISTSDCLTSATL